MLMFSLSQLKRDLVFTETRLIATQNKIQSYFRYNEYGEQANTITPEQQIEIDKLWERMDDLGETFDAINTMIETYRKHGYT